MRKWIRRGFNVFTALVMLALLIHGPGHDRLTWTLQFAVFGLAGFNAGWWVCAKHAENTAKLAIMGSIKSNRPVKVTRFTIPPERG